MGGLSGQAQGQRQSGSSASLRAFLLADLRFTMRFLAIRWNA
jgi:hypothetical protein